MKLKKKQKYTGRNRTKRKKLANAHKQEETVRIWREKNGGNLGKWEETGRNWKNKKETGKDRMNLQETGRNKMRWEETRRNRNKH